MEYYFYCTSILHVAFVKLKLLDYTLAVTDSVKFYSVNNKQDLQISPFKKVPINFDASSAGPVTNRYSKTMKN